MLSVYQLNRSYISPSNRMLCCHGNTDQLRKKPKSQVIIWNDPQVMGKEYPEHKAVIQNLQQ